MMKWSVVDQKMRLSEEGLKRWGQYESGVKNDVIVRLKSQKKSQSGLYWG